MYHSAYFYLNSWNFLCLQFNHFSPLVNLTNRVCKYRKIVSSYIQWGRQCWVLSHVENRLVQWELLVSICSIPLFQRAGTDKVHSNNVRGDSQLFFNIDNFIISSKTEKAFHYLPKRNIFCMPLTSCTSFHYSSDSSVCNNSELWMILSCKTNIHTLQMKCTACVSSSFSTHFCVDALNLSSWVK